MRDQLGSVIGVTNARGKVLGATRYGAYGAVEASRGQEGAERGLGLIGQFPINRTEIIAARI